MFFRCVIAVKCYIVPERKLGFFVKIKPPARRAYAPEGKTKILTTGILVVFRGLKFESDADIGGKDSFRSGTTKDPWIKFYLHTKTNS